MQPSTSIRTKFNPNSAEWTFQISGVRYTVDSLDSAIQALRSLVVSDCHLNWNASFIDCCQFKINLAKQRCLIKGFYGESNWNIVHKSILAKLSPTKVAYNDVDLVLVCAAILEYQNQQEILQTEYTWNLIETFVNRSVILLLGQFMVSNDANKRLKVLCGVLGSRPPAESLVLLNGGCTNLNSWRSHFYTQAVDLIATWDEVYPQYNKITEYLAGTLNLEITGQC